MNPLASLAPFAQAFGWAVVHSLWQIALIWLVFKLLEWRLSRRHQAVYLLSLAAMFVSAIWAAVTFAGEFARATLAAQEIFLTENLPSQAVLNLENTVGSFEAALSPTLLETAQIWLETHSAQIGWAWLACAALLWLRLIGGWWLAQRLRHRNVSPAAEAFQSLCDGWAKRLRINPKIELLESPHISEPLTLGFWKPVVLFPVGMLLQLSPAQVEALLVHELAHVRRHDYLLNLFQLALEVCFFYHPLFWLLSREARSRREFCCDEVVMRHTPDPILYARTLTDLQLSFLHPSTQFVMNATGKSRFTERILHIAGISPKRSARPNFLLALLLPLAIGLSSWWPSAKNLPSDESSVSMEMLATDSLPPQKTAQPNPKIARPREMAKPAQPKDKVFSDHPVLETEQPTDRPNTVAMEAVKMNVLYIGVDNPLRVAVSGVPANELQVQLIGKGSMTGSDGNYNVRVVEPGEVTVRVLHKIGDKIDFVIDQKYRVKRIPDPAPMLDGQYRSCSVVADLMQQTKGLRPMLENFDFDIACEIVGFEATYLPKEEDAIARVNKGGEWNAGVLEWIKKAKPGDAFFFDDIQVMCPGDAKPRNVGGLAFKIKPVE